MSKTRILLWKTENPPSYEPAYPPLRGVHSTRQARTLFHIDACLKRLSTFNAGEANG